MDDFKKLGAQEAMALEKMNIRFSTEPGRMPEGQNEVV